jgi:hypothetical protein
VSRSNTNQFLGCKRFQRERESYEGRGAMAASTNPTAFIYLLLVVAFMTLVLVSHDPSHHHPRSHRRTLPGKRIKVRAVHHDKNHHDPVAFDPVVADFERRKEDRAWEKQYFEDQYKKWGDEAQHAEGINFHPGEPLKVVLTSISRLSWASSILSVPYCPFARSRTVSCLPFSVQVLIVGLEMAGP